MTTPLDRDGRLALIHYVILLLFRPISALSMLPMAPIPPPSTVRIERVVDRHASTASRRSEENHRRLSRRSIIGDRSWLLSLLQLSALKDSTQHTKASVVSSRGFQVSSMSTTTTTTPFTKLERDKVERILDGNTVKLQKKGIVILAGVRMPSPTCTSGNFQFPSCFTYSPSYKLRQILPASAAVQVETISPPSPLPSSSSSSSTTTNAKKISLVVLVRTQDSLVVNQEPVRTGFAKVVMPRPSKQHQQASSSLLLDYQALSALEDHARSQGLGIFVTCDGSDDTMRATELAATSSDSAIYSTAPFEAEFEPLERSMETVYTADGGRQQLRINDDNLDGKNNPNGKTPANPGDTKSCANFDTYEAALEWFERFEPYYGDVAKLDRDGDGVPCPGLPHTTNRERYRMKVPKPTTSKTTTSTSTPMTVTSVHQR